MRQIIQFLFTVLSLFLLAINPMAAQTTVQIQVGTTTRSMIVYVPQSLSQNQPLVISMHGLNQSPTYQMDMAKWAPIADKERFSVVYPAGINNSWDLNGTSDTNFILAIIDYMANHYGADRNRIYLSGFSMGGMMTYHAANVIADKIAAFAPISGYLMNGPNTNSSRPIPIIHTHGTADNVVAYSGVQTCIDAWKTRNGCPTTAVVTKPYPADKPNSPTTKSYWGPGTNGVAIVLMTIAGKGHWVDIDPNGTNTSQEIWNFCKNFSLSSCTPTSIVPNIQVNGGSWQQTSSVTVTSGSTVVLGPQPTTGGSWSWSGGGTSGTSRQQTIQPTSSCTATATYTNLCGATTSQVFTITVSGGTTTGLVNNGVYVIEFKTDATKALDLLNGTDADGTAIRPWTKNGTTAQQWVAKDAGNGYWRFVSNASSSNRCIDLSGANTANGTKIQLWTNYSNDAQAWQVTDAGSGYYKIVSKVNTSRGFDVANCVVDGTQNLQLWDYYGTSCQLFKFNLVTTKSARVSDVSDDGSISVYPNPSVNGKFTVSITNLKTDDLKLTVYSLDGKKLFEKVDLKEGVNDINSGLKKGFYMIKINSYTQKIVIE